MKKARKILTLLVIVAEFTSCRSIAQNLDVIYVPTPQPVVDKMLDMANVGPGDYLIDLGSGDGRIVVSAAKRGAYALGVDLDPKRVREAKINAIKGGVTDQTMFLEQNIFDTDLSKATVVTMYLLESLNIALRPILYDQLAPGTRIVSHDFWMGSWEADEEYHMDIYDDDDCLISSVVYFWVIPAKVEGEWELTIGEKSLKMIINQEFQKISIEMFADEIPLIIKNPQINGDRISFIATDHIAKVHFAFNGKAYGNNIGGIVHIDSNNYEKLENWQARLKE
jgi:hypothetical protein